MNIDESFMESAITPKTKAIVPVHYAGVGCEMNTIMSIAGRHGLFVIEDAAQGMSSPITASYWAVLDIWLPIAFTRQKTAPAEAKAACSSSTMGVLLSAQKSFREKGTNRSQFFRGMVDEYTWVDLGSSYLPSELQAAYLWGQLEWADKIMQNRLLAWHGYREALEDLEQKDLIELPTIPNQCKHNGHMFYVKCRNFDERTALLAHLKSDGIYAVFHYVPLHSAPAGLKFSRFHGEDRYTTQESSRLVRLPIWYGIESETTAYIANSVRRFYGFRQPSDKT